MARLVALEFWKKEIVGIPMMEGTKEGKMNARFKRDIIASLDEEISALR